MSDAVIAATLERERRKAEARGFVSKPKRRRTIRKLKARTPAAEPSHIEWQPADG